MGFFSALTGNPAKAASNPLRQGTAQAGTADAGRTAKTGTAAPTAPAEGVTLGGAQKTSQSAIQLRQYKYSVAQDTAFVRETLRHKLAEYSLNPATRLAVQKNSAGLLEVQANMPDAARQAIEADLNQNQTFRDAFARLSVTKPTLEYVDNVMKLNKAYGTANPLFESLVSRESSANGLQDIAHRYEALKRTLPETAQADLPSGDRQRFAIGLNTSA